MVGLRDAPPGRRSPGRHRVARPTQHVGGPGALRPHPHRPDHLLVADLDAGDGLGRLVPHRQAVLGAGRFPVPRRPAGLPQAPPQPLVPADPPDDPRAQHCRGRGAGLPVLRHPRRGPLPGDGHVGWAVEHHERDRRDLEPPGDLRVGGDLRVQGQGTSARVGRPDGRVDHRLRPVELRLRVQLPGRPRLVLGRRTAGLVHDPRPHAVREGGVDPVPGLHADLLVGRGADLPALHAGFGVRPPQRPQPHGDVPHLRRRPGGEPVGLRQARACDHH